MIPTYNRARLLFEAVDSALSQDYPNLEVIVSDNASTDDTSEVIKKYLPDTRFRYSRNQTNIGLGANWRKLLYEHATGEYGKLLNDDDYLIDKNHISKAVCLLRRHRLNAVFSGSKIIREKDVADEHFVNEIVFDLPPVVARDWWIANLGKYQQQIVLFPNLAGGAVFGLKKARQLNAFSPGVYGLDYELALKLILSGDTGYLQGHHWAERHHDSDGNTASFAKAYEGTELFERVYDYGISLGLNKKSLVKLKLRALSIFIQVFVVGKWTSEKGVSLKSLCSLSKKIYETDPRVLWPTIIAVPTISELLKAKNERLHSLLRKLYRLNKRTPGKQKAGCAQPARDPKPSG